MKRQFIGLKGDKELWEKFVAKAKEDHASMWEVLEVFIKEYLAGNVTVQYRGSLVSKKR